MRLIVSKRPFHGLDAFHGASLSRSQGCFKAGYSLPSIVWTALTLLMPQVAEAMLRTITCLLLTPISSLDTFARTTHFSALGRGDIAHPGHEWRTLSGVQSAEPNTAGWLDARFSVCGAPTG